MKSLKLNDKVLVIAGDNKGKETRIVSIDRKNGRACLEGIGQFERHLKKSRRYPNGGKKKVHASIDLSNLKLVEAHDRVKSVVKKVDENKKDVKKGAK